ncbi:MAG: hypothetical protein LBQ08_03960 [Holosporaceae bacterium]|nr:hypothetical protein [Holosporaceae bacterium]
MKNFIKSMVFVLSAITMLEGDGMIYTNVMTYIDNPENTRVTPSSRQFAPAVLEEIVKNAPNWNTRNLQHALSSNPQSECITIRNSMSFLDLAHIIASPAPDYAVAQLMYASSHNYRPPFSPVINIPGPWGQRSFMSLAATTGKLKTLLVMGNLDSLLLDDYFKLIEIVFNNLSEQAQVIAFKKVTDCVLIGYNSRAEVRNLRDSQGRTLENVINAIANSRSREIARNIFRQRELID